MTEKGLEGKRRDKYPSLRGLLEKEFGGLRGFTKKTGICHSVVTRVIHGDRKEARARIADAIRRLRPDSDLSGIWEKAAGAKRRMSRGKVIDGCVKCLVKKWRLKDALELEKKRVMAHA